MIIRQHSINYSPYLTNAAFLHKLFFFDLLWKEKKILFLRKKYLAKKFKYYWSFFFFKYFFLQHYHKSILGKSIKFFSKFLLWIIILSMFHIKTINESIFLEKFFFFNFKSSSKKLKLKKNFFSKKETIHFFKIFKKNQYNMLEINYYYFLFNYEKKKKINYFKD